MSAPQGRNGKSAASPFGKSRGLTMDQFDLLPREWRDCLNYHPFNCSITPAQLTCLLWGIGDQDPKPPSAEKIRRHIRANALHTYGPSHPQAQPTLEDLGL